MVRKGLYGPPARQVVLRNNVPAPAAPPTAAAYRWPRTENVGEVLECSGLSCDDGAAWGFRCRGDDQVVCSSRETSPPDGYQQLRVSGGDVEVIGQDRECGHDVIHKRLALGTLLPFANSTPTSSSASVIAAMATSSSSAMSSSSSSPARSASIRNVVSSRIRVRIAARPRSAGGERRDPRANSGRGDGSEARS